MSSISQPGNFILHIPNIGLPDLSNLPQVDMFWLVVTAIIIGGIIFLEILVYLFSRILGNPVYIAASADKKCIIEHFDTPKSARFKLAQISGGGFKYEDVRDGTVAAISESVLGVVDRQMVLTFAQFGATVPTKVLGGISVLIQSGINNLDELKNRYYSDKVYEIDVNDVAGDGTVLPTTHKEQTVIRTLDDQTIISGYPFDKFEQVLKENDEEKLVPLTIERVPDFVDKNISADYNESIINLSKQTFSKPDDPAIKQMFMVVFSLVILIIVGMLVK